MLSLTKRIAHNLLHLFSGEALSSGIAFITTVWLARKLSQEGFGYWSFVQSIVIYFVLFVDMGLSTFGVREIAKNKTHPNELICGILSIRFINASVLFFLVSTVILLLDISKETQILFIGAFLWLFIQALNPEFIFQGLEKMFGIACWRAMSHLLYLLPVLYFIQNKSDLAKVPYLRFLGAVIPALILLFYLNRKLHWLKNIKIDIHRFSSYLKISVVMAGSLFVIKLYYTFDTIMLGIMDSASAVGLYNAAYKIILLFIGVATLIQAAFSPAISNTRGEPVQLEKIVRNYSIIIGFFACLFFGVTIISSHQIIEIVFGAGYKSSSFVLTLLSFSGFLVFICTIYLSPLLFCNRHKNYLQSVSIGAAANVLLNLMLIPRFGLVGAAAATILSNIGILIIAAFNYKKLTGRAGQLWLGSSHILIFGVLIVLLFIIQIRWWLEGVLYCSLVCAVYFLFYKNELGAIFNRLFRSKVKLSN